MAERGGAGGEGGGVNMHPYRRGQRVEVPDEGDFRLYNSAALSCKQAAVFMNIVDCT